MSHLVLKLYVAGASPNSLAAQANLNRFCAEHLDGHHQIQVIDVLKEPSRALSNGIFVTPTLVRVTPEPVQSVIGNLSNIAQLHAVLSLNAV